MSIASEITRINNNIASAYSQCQSKGATMPATQNSANLANTISTISGGGGADLSQYFNTNVSSTFDAAGNNFWRKSVLKFPTIILNNNITSLNYMFYYSPFEELSFDGLDLSNITNIEYMFSTPNSIVSAFPMVLKKVDLSNITNASSITTARYLFQYQKELETISNMFSLSGAVNLWGAFDNCQKLLHLDLSNWNITSVGSGRATNMFRYTYKLATLDISGMDLHSFNYTTGIFQDCGINCLQSDGAYADGIPYVYVKNQTEQEFVLNLSGTYRPASWTTSNVVVKSS